MVGTSDWNEEKDEWSSMTDVQRRKEVWRTQIYEERNIHFGRKKHLWIKDEVTEKTDPDKGTWERNWKRLQILWVYERQL